MAHITLGKRYAVAVDEADLQLIRDYSWWVETYESGCTYARGAHKVTGKKIFMHRLITAAPRGLHVDHRDGNGLNNSRGNLRACTGSQNQGNKRPNSVRRSSRFKGVWRSHKKWAAGVTHQGKAVYHARFANEEEAARAYDSEANKYHGEFALTNVMLGLIAPICHEERANI